MSLKDAMQTQTLCVLYPWNDCSHVYTGIVSHVATLLELTLLQEDQKSLIDNFLSRVKVSLQEYGIDKERLMVKNLNWILDQFRNELNAHGIPLKMPTRGDAVPAECMENIQKYTVHMH